MKTITYTTSKLAATKGIHHHTLDISKNVLSAIVNNIKYDVICPAELNVQKGDLISFNIRDGIRIDTMHADNHLVFEATFVSYIPQFSSPNTPYVAVSVKPNKKFSFWRAGLNDYDDNIEEIVEED